MGSEPRHPSISSNALQPLENEKRICASQWRIWHRKLTYSDPNKCGAPLKLCERICCP